MKSVIFSGVFLVVWDSQFQANSLNKALPVNIEFILTRKHREYHHLSKEKKADYRTDLESRSDCQQVSGTPSCKMSDLVS